MPSTAVPTAHRRSGFTLLEAAVVLSLLALALSLSVPLGRGTLDLWTVRSVRDQTLAALHRTRMEARLRGGAELVVRGEQGVLEVWGTDSLLWISREPRDAGVRVSLPDGRPDAELTFDGLGLGVVTSRTLVFRKGAAEARLVISSRGRGARR
jgi:type II secretory pathway pseudopilin PulG